MYLPCFFTFQLFIQFLNLLMLLLNKPLVHINHLSHLLSELPRKMYFPSCTSSEILRDFSDSHLLILPTDTLLFFTECIVNSSKQSNHFISLAA